jgi:hypothetical protein
MDRLIYI